MIRPFETTGIGSLPFTDADAAVRLVLSHCDIPFWPQLPHRSFKELMVPQYSEGLPGVVVDQEKEKVFVGRADQDELNRFYELFSAGEDFPVSEEYSAGFYAFLREIGGRRFGLLKGQITGPLTFTLGLKDSDGRYIYFNEELREVASLLLQRKAQWQVRELSAYAGKVIIFVDEPILTAIGSSSYLGVEPAEAERLLRDTVDAVHSAGGLAGIHCCGKADWGMLIRTGVDILNFDAYDYFETLQIYTDELAGFLRQGGYLAWGIVPTTGAIRNERLDVLRDRLLSRLNDLSAGIPGDLVTERSLLTPSCGAGGRTEEEAEKVFSFLRSLGETMRR
ncbi:MAG TPA: methionine synthase [Nitrospirae bacterium]|nr:methionine synthase [Nitrospirota bacterium]